MMGKEEVADPRLDVTRVGKFVDMLLEDITRGDDAAVEDSKVERLLEVEGIVGIPVASTVELGVSWELVGCFSAGGSDATELMMPGSSLGSATFPLTVHPPEALGQAGALNVGL